MERQLERQFEQFYGRHYSRLPEWVNESLFKNEMKDLYISMMKDAHEQGESQVSGGGLLHPLISGMIDMGGYDRIDNYAFYFENPEQKLYTGYAVCTLEVEQSPDHILTSGTFRLPVHRPDLVNSIVTLQNGDREAPTLALITDVEEDDDKPGFIYSCIEPVF